MKIRRTKLRHILPALISLIIGFLLTFVIGSLIYEKTNDTWQQTAIKDSEAITDIMQYWLELEKEPLRSIATLFFGSEIITPVELNEAIDLLEHTQDYNREISVGFVSERYGGDYLVTMMAGSNGIITLNRNMTMFEPGVITLAKALNQPDKVVLGPIFKTDNGGNHALYAMVVPNGEDGGVLMSVLDLDLLLKGLAELHIQPGLGLVIAADSENQININLMDQEAAFEHNVRVMTSGIELKFSWFIYDNYAGGGNYNLFRFVTTGGIILTILVSMLINFLYRQNLLISQKVRRRTKELSDTLEALQTTQKQLVHSEKMASLGSLVAGVAHELNTPIGNSLVAATALRQKNDEVTNRLNNNQLKKSEFKSYMELSQNTCSLIERNIYRSTELIKSFKQVAVDQTSERRRLFNLSSTFDEVLATLSPKLKRTEHLVSLDIDPTIQMDGYPGPLGQVISNLITNTLLHGFEDKESGQIIITAHPSDLAKVLIVYEDNGCGIDNVHLEKIFDPFFTTKMGQGGSGLGLNIVYNIVNSMLGGTIKVESTKNQGVNFRISLPLSAPDVTA